jgi:hypothetical protein
LYNNSYENIIAPCVIYDMKKGEFEGIEIKERLEERGI